ncbi:peptide synthase condensation domain-containing protein (plasmid) [Streptomyces lunaelactis]|uniref:Peptide synthase condensation domain-containing protein n=1 Tax=Streptomyces lunaelactis TaxID=1535768 RepID=A0A2R4TFN4_9ACTN|nr:condensation domain-containing protein [Streptomyces lunaelactis]AVZ77942.1 peptide synthase condensation domain-containing protein [Streptomyces lunaelactis]NUK86112.1 peptide synthase condensation domain-containing protein [Streptomyces lunaelactis]
MTSHPARIPQDETMTVVADLGAASHGALPVLELHGSLDTARVEAALDSIAIRHPDAPAWRPALETHGPGHHTLRFTADAGAAHSDFPLGLLADLLTNEPASCVLPARRAAATPLQRELLADADAHPGTGRQVEQLAWDWHGPLDTERFTAAWRSVFDCESVLRTAFDDGPEPGIVVHDKVEPEVVRLAHGTADWRTLVERDRSRGLDPRRPGPLRVTVLGGGPVMFATATPTRVLLTYHHALLDGWSVRLLLREFYRAYLAGGLLPGGERRPDMGDYAQWLTGQYTAPAQDFWSRSVPPGPAPAPGAPGLPAFPAFTGTDTSATGSGRARLRLTPEETARLATWAAGWGAAESTVLQAVWALLLYRTGRAAGAAPVRFCTTVSGRGILFDGVERLPGALCNPQPLSVVVDPRATVPSLLAELRDRALDMAAYEWVSAGQIRSWAKDALAPADSLLAFETRPRIPDDVECELAALGVHVEPPETLSAHTAFPLTLVAHHDGAGRLVLTASYDQARLADAAEVLAYSVLLLRELPDRAGESTTVAQVLELLSGMSAGPGSGAGRGGGAGEAAAAPASVVLRPAAHSGAGTVALVQATGTPSSFYERLARAYPGPEELVLLCPVPGGAPAWYCALGPRIDAGRQVAFGGFSGDGVAVYEIARLVAAHGGRPRVVVLTGATAGADELARMLDSATRRLP